MHVRIAMVLAGLFACGSALEAQPKTLTLDQANQIALERNLSVVQAQSNVNAAQAGVLAAYGTYLPSLSASGGWNRQQTDQAGGVKIISGQPFVLPATSTTTNYFSSSLALSYDLFDGFARGARVNQAVSNSVSAENTASRTRQSIVFQTQSAYLTVLRNEQLVSVNEENLKRDQRQLERIVESSKVGALAAADVYRQQSAVSADEFQLITAQNNFDKSKADLLALIGEDVSQEYTIADPSISPDVDTTEMAGVMQQYADFNSLSKQALAIRPDYLGAQQNLDAAESGVTIAKSSYMPSISAGAGYNIGNEEFNRIMDNKTLSWGINIRWTLFDGFQTNMAIQSAVAQKRNAEISLAQAQLAVNVDVKKALLDLDASRKQYESAQKGLVSATEDRKIAEEKYNLGAGTLLDLLTANANLVQAEYNKVNAVYNYITAKLNMEYVLGAKPY